MPGDLMREAINEVVADILEKNKFKGDLLHPKKDDVGPLRASLLEISETVFDSEGRAASHIRYFLNGKGKNLYFNLSELFAEDKGARERVYSETTRRSLGVKTVREKLQNCTVNNGSQGIDPIITIFQSNFSTVDWWGALGTFGVQFDIIGTRVGNTAFLVNLSGTNKYQWHPDRNGKTKIIHRIGYALNEIGGGKNFDMIGKPVAVFVDPVMKIVLERTTTKQSMPDERDNSEIFFRIAKKYPGKTLKYAAKYVNQL